jgi:hypothetical protein
MGHLQDNGLSYFKHLKYSLSYAFISFKATFYFTIHAFCPDVYTTSGSETVDTLNQNIKTTNLVLHSSL